MFKLCFILIFTFNFFFLFSQDTHFQWEGTTNAPNAHFRIFSDGRIFLFAADNSGRVNINYFRPTELDSIFITSIGFKTRKLSCLELQKMSEIQLEEDVFSLNEMVVTPARAGRIRTMRLGNTSAFASFSTNVFFSWQLVLFIPYNPLAGNILKLRYYMGGRLNSKLNFMSDRPFRVRLYEKDSINNSVGKDMLIDFLIVSHNSSYGWLEVDISNYNISMPKHGVFVGFEILPAEYYINNNIISSHTVNHSLHPSLGNSVSFGVTRFSRSNEYWSSCTYSNKWSLCSLNTNFLLNIEVERK